MASKPCVTIELLTYKDLKFVKSYRSFEKQLIDYYLAFVDIDIITYVVK